MQRWEYTTWEHKWDMSALEKALREYGDQGWELASMMRETPLHICFPPVPWFPTAIS